MKIVFAWELGSNLGHLHTIAGPAKELASRGHDVSVISQNITSAYPIFFDTPIDIFQSPVADRDISNPAFFTQQIEGYADAISLFGYKSTETLTAAIFAWRSLLSKLRPDVFVCNACAIALLAARSLDLNTVTLGTGYHTPPLTNPLPSFNFAFGKEIEPNTRLLMKEKRLVEISNEALTKVGCSNHLIGLCDMFDVKYHFLTTFKELDHYPNRNWPLTSYWGSQFSSGTKSFLWKNFKNGEEQIKVFIYARGGRMQLIASELEKNGELCVFASSGDTNLNDARRCDIAVTYGSHGITSAMLLAGIPVLLIPGNIEQMVVSQAVVGLNAGIIGFPTNSGNLLELVLETLKRKPGALSFAGRYPSYNVSLQNRLIANKIEDLS